MFKRMLEICEREDPAYTVLHQNATFTAKRKDIRWKASPVLRDGVPHRATSPPTEVAMSAFPWSRSRDSPSISGRTVRAPSTASISSIAPGEALGIVGESGSGKSVTWLAALRPAARRAPRVGGSVRLEGQQLIGAPARLLEQRARQAHRHDLPGPVELPQPGASHRPASSARR